MVSGVVWGLLFGVVHLAWAAGSRFGLVETAAADVCLDLLAGGDEDPSFVTTLGGPDAAQPGEPRVLVGQTSEI